MMPLFVKSRRTGTMNPDFTLSFSCALPLAHTHRMACISIHRRSQETKSCINGNISFIKGWLLHQPTVSDGYTASICPGVVSCSKSALILTNSVCIQSCKLRSLLGRNPVTEGRCSFFHTVLLDIHHRIRQWISIIKISYLQYM